MSMNIWCTVSLYARFFSSIWRMQKKNVSVFDLLLDTHTDDPQQFRLCMDLTLREGYWIKFNMKLIAAIYPCNHYSPFYRPCKVVQNNRLLPLIRQLFLTPNKCVYGSQTVVFYFLLQSVLPEFCHCLILRESIICKWTKQEMQ
jgi:hypothetical protein